MDFEITLDHQNKVVHYRHRGIITKENIGCAWKELLKLKEFTDLEYNLFTDYREAKYDIDLNEVHEITNFLATLEPILNGKKQAMLLKDPIDTANSLIFEELVSSKIGFIVQVFCTKEAALLWVVN